MQVLFDTHHGKQTLRHGPGLTKNFLEILKKKFGKTYKVKTLYLVTRILTRFRIRTINRLVKQRKQKGQIRFSLRGKVKTQQQAWS